MRHTWSKSTFVNPGIHVGALLLQLIDPGLHLSHLSFQSFNLLRVWTNSLVKGPGQEIWGWLFKLAGRHGRGYVKGGRILSRARAIGEAARHVRGVVV